jgi:hypothetical protein
MIVKIMDAIMQRKMYFAIALAALVIVAYAVPYGMEVQAKPGNDHGRHYGLVQGEGYGLSCDHFLNGLGPIRCR